MTEASLLLVAAAVLAFALFAKRVGQSILTGPMLFLAFGLLLNTFGGVEIVEAEELLHVLAEVTLVRHAGSHGARKSLPTEAMR